MSTKDDVTLLVMKGVISDLGKKERTDFDRGLRKMKDLCESLNTEEENLGDLVLGYYAVERAAEEG